MNIPYFKFGSPTLCTYCGDVPSGVDHVIAIASQTIMRKRSDKTSYGPVTHCCASCNTAILSSRGFDSFYERCQFVSRKLEKKAAPIEWSQHQLSQFDYKLRTFIENENRKRMWWRWRADWFQSREWVLNLEGILHEDCLDARSPKYSSELAGYFDSTIRFIKVLKPEW